MNTTASPAATESAEHKLLQNWPLWALLGGALFLTVFHTLLPDWLYRLPGGAPGVPDPNAKGKFIVGFLPLSGYLDAGFNQVRDEIMVVTRWFARGLGLLLDIVSDMLVFERRTPWPRVWLNYDHATFFVRVGPVPWMAIAVVAGVIGHYLGGWRMAILGGGTFVWIALIGQWKIAMETLSVISISVPVAFLLGLVLGILAWKYAFFNKIIRPFLSLLQTMPFLTYLLPAVIFFKVGPTAAAVATIVYAIPPMVLMTTLGLQKVSSEIVESGKMCGCTRWQMLRHVYIPSARTQILVGVNQVIMLSLAMVVLTAFIGMPGLGAKLLETMGSFKLGRSFEIGISIVLIAVMLDRLSKAWIVKQPEHFDRATPFWKLHFHLLIGIGLFIVVMIVSQFVQVVDHIAKGQDFSKSKEIDTVIKAFVSAPIVTSVTDGLRGFFNTQLLIPFKTFLLWLPTSAVILLMTAFAYGLGGRRSAMLGFVFFTYVALSGWWDAAVTTLYFVISATFLAMIFSLPLAIWASHSKRASEWVLLVCDTAQTFPSFVYLIPVIMLFGVSPVAVVFAIMIFAAVPLVRYTVEGLRGVPPEMVEAADMAGASRMQKLMHVKFPLALPIIAIGFNQAIMFAFFMVIIAVFIGGTQDLGEELLKTMGGSKIGTNFVLGLNVSLMALTFALTLTAWSDYRKKILGLSA